jgi:RNA polymerase sigma factor (sigma-70 family)
MTVRRRFQPPFPVQCGTGGARNSLDPPSDGCNRIVYLVVIGAVEPLGEMSQAMPVTNAFSFDEFYSSDYPKAVRLVYALLNPHDSAEDIVQEAFARVWERFGSIDNPSGFLRVTVVNLCRDAQRRQGRERRPYVRLHEPDAISDQTVEMVELLMQLPYRQRATLVLRYWVGLSEAEIADALGCRPGTVKTLAQRGLRRLRKVVES